MDFRGSFFLELGGVPGHLLSQRARVAEWQTRQT